MATRDEITIPPSGLVTADVAARVAGVTPGTIRAWKSRGHLDLARDLDGTPLLDSSGRQLFEILDVINVEYKLRDRARRRQLVLR